MGLVFIVGVIAGAYPSLILSGFKPIEVLKSKTRLAGSNIFTKSLVTVQFTLSVSLIISTLVIIQQLKLMRSKNPGFNKENMLVVDADGTDSKKVYSLFKLAVQKQPFVIGVAASEMGLGKIRAGAVLVLNTMEKTKRCMNILLIITTCR
jgi:putative ABC transport system permease protein